MDVPSGEAGSVKVVTTVLQSCLKSWGVCLTGLAEAGLISSNLSVGEIGQDRGALFQPDR